MAARKSSKVTIKRIYKGRGVAVVRCDMPPKSASRRRKEPHSHIVLPLTAGTLERHVYRTVRGKVAVKKKKIQLKPFVPFERNVAHDHVVHNTGRKMVVVLKVYSRRP